MANQQQTASRPPVTAQTGQQPKPQPNPPPPPDYGSVVQRNI